MNCPYCNNILFCRANDKLCDRDKNHSFYYYSEINYHLSVNNQQIGRDEEGYYLDIDSSNMSSNLIEIPPFEVKDIKIMLEKHLKLLMFL